MKHTIDAQNKKLGRVASEAAKILIGKQSTDFTRNTFPTLIVHIVNASKVSMDAKKLREKEYVRYSGFPGGIKRSSGQAVVAKKGYSILFRDAVYGMLPSNKLRAKIIKNLIVTE